MKNVLITTSSFAADDSSPLERLKQEGFQVQLNPYKRKLTKEELLELLPGHIGLIAGLETLDYDVLSRSSLKVISRCGAGLANVDLEGARKLNITVFNTPDAPSRAVAELTVGALLNLLRHISLMDRELHTGKWSKRTGQQIMGKTIAIIGFGRIGQCVAQLLNSFNVKIVVVDPLLKGPQNFPVLSLDEALAEADIVLLHPSGEEKILSEREFKLMKKGVYILNAARGKLIDEAALIKALKEKVVAGAWLDVFEQEPYTGELRQFEQVILTPHVGSYTVECRKAMEMEAVDNLIKGLN